jgi:uncharacterized metal-binding protein YceD (DUF177 family)
MRKHSQRERPAGDSERRSERRSERPWSVPFSVHEVPETGRRVELHADAQTRAAVAALAGVRDLPRLEAAFEVTRHGQAGLRVTGRVSATVGQVCVVTLEPMQSEIDEPVDLVFAPPAAPVASDRASAADEIEVTENAPEVLVGGTVDLGAVATEFLILALDPYPRKPGAVFEGPAVEDDAGHPFAALAALKERQQPD